MGAVVSPDAPIIVGVSLGVFAVLVVQERDDLLQHWLGHRKARAKDRARELKREVRADALGCDEVFDARSCTHTRGVVKLDAFVDALVDGIMHCGFEMSLCQRLAILEVALIEKLVARDRNPIDVAKPSADADTGAVLGVVELGRRYAAAPQLREGGILVLAGPLDIHDSVARDPALTLHLGTELARRAEFNVIWKELIIDRVGAPLDDDAVRLQHEPRHHTVFTASAHQGREHSDDRGKEPPTRVFANLAVVEHERVRITSREGSDAPITEGPSAAASWRFFSAVNRPSSCGRVPLHGLR